MQTDHQQAASHIQQLQTQLANTQQRLVATKDKKEQLEDQVALLVGFLSELLLISSSADDNHRDTNFLFQKKANSVSIPFQKR